MEKVIKEIKEWNGITVFGIGTVYHALLVSIMLRKCGKRDNVVLFISIEKNLVKETKDKLAHFADMWNQQGMKSYVFERKSTVLKIIGVDEICGRKKVDDIFKNQGITKENCLLICFAWRFETIHFPFAYVLRKSKKALFVNDSPNIMKIDDKYRNFRAVVRRIYDGSHKLWWENEKIEGLYFENDKYILPDMRKKSKIISMEYDMNKYDREWVIRMMLNGEEKKDLLAMRKMDGIVFTSPFSNARYMSEKEQRDLFRKVYVFYSKYGKIAFKVHPRDDVNYEGIGCDYISYGRYPAELYTIAGIRFKFAVAVSSAAIYSVNADYKIVLDGDGEMSFLFKSNKKIDMIPIDLKNNKEAERNAES